VGRVRLPSKPVLADVLLAAVLTGLTVVTVTETATRVDWPAGVIAVLTVAPIALRQLAPVLTATVVAVALAAYNLLGYGEFPNGGVGLMVGMFTVATLRSRSVSAVMYAVSASALALAYVTDGGGMIWSQLLEGSLILLGAWMLGEGTKRWARRAERLAAEKAQAVADERVRIARELHDIVAHHMSVISLQAGVADYVADVDPPAAKKAIATVGEASREALLDMRRLLDVLRVDHRDGDDDFMPQPGLAQLDDLAHRMHGAGLPVDVAVTGAVRPLPPGPDLCAYRVVQESLTNVLKHAGPAKARVEVYYGPRTVTVTVADDGTKAHPSSGSPTAHGIRGMRERAELYGGVLSAGPSREGGFAVKLRLPMDEAP
jgi:signal transduction histidine kinase